MEVVALRDRAPRIGRGRLVVAVEAVRATRGLVLTEADAETQARILLAESGRSTQRQRTRMLVDTALTPRI